MWLRATHGPVPAAQVSAAPAGQAAVVGLLQLYGAARLVSQQRVQVTAGAPEQVPFSLIRTPTPFVGMVKAPTPPQVKLTETLVAGFVNVTTAPPAPACRPPCVQRSAAVAYGMLYGRAVQLLPIAFAIWAIGKICLLILNPMFDAMAAPPAATINAAAIRTGSVIFDEPSFIISSASLPIAMANRHPAFLTVNRNQASIYAQKCFCQQKSASTLPQSIR